MKKMILLPVLLVTQLHGQLTVTKERSGGIDRDTQVVTDVVFEGGADTLMDVTKRGDEADSMKVLRVSTNLQMRIVAGTLKNELTSEEFDATSLHGAGVDIVGTRVARGRHAMGALDENFPENPLAGEKEWLVLSGNIMWRLGNGELPFLFVVDDSWSMVEWAPDIGETPVFPLTNHVEQALIMMPGMPDWEYKDDTWQTWVFSHGLPFFTHIDCFDLEIVIYKNMAYVPVAARLDPVLVKDSKTNVVWRVYAENGRFFATIEEEKQ